MRHPFYMDHLEPTDRKAVKRLYVRIMLVYCWFAVFALADGALHAVSESRADAGQHDGARSNIARASELVGASAANAAEATDRTLCATRDLRLVNALEAHGEAQDVAANVLREVFFTMAKARTACAAGRVSEALAIYDAIVIDPASPYRHQDD